MDRPTISIANNNLPLLIKAQELIGGKLYGSVGKGSKQSANTKWRLELAPFEWASWLARLPLIVKEDRRQEFLFWLIRIGRYGKLSVA